MVSPSYQLTLLLGVSPLDRLTCGLPLHVSCILWSLDVLGGCIRPGAIWGFINSLSHLALTLCYVSFRANALGQQKNYCPLHTLPVEHKKIISD